MKDDKEFLSKLGDTLAKTMNKITSNFRLGFGSFVDNFLQTTLKALLMYMALTLYQQMIKTKAEIACDFIHGFGQRITQFREKFFVVFH